LEWTWSLLEQDECVLARRLGVFLGGWTLEAAETVCSGVGLDESTVEAFASTQTSPMMKAEALHLRGLLEASEGASATAGRLIEQAVALRRPTRDQQGLVRTLTSLAHIWLDQGQTDAAQAAFAEAVQLARTSGERVRVIRALEGLARSVAKVQPDGAVRLAGA